MLAARKIEETCNCGTRPVAYCEECGKPLCSNCMKIEITGMETKRIAQKIFCATCHADPRINIWGTLYWPRTSELFI